MSSKKHPKPGSIVKHKWKGRKKFDPKSANKLLPDTSRIPWFPTTPKTGTDV